jgi:hypothetical protein
MTDQLENGKFKRDGVRKMRLYLIDEVDVLADKLEIGTADVEQGANGALIIDLFMAGMWTDPAIMSECLTMKGFIRTEMRKE